MATTQDHITELNLWRAQYTGSAAAVITDLRQTVERYREVVGEVGPKPQGSPPREREREHIPKATAVPEGTQQGEEDTRQGGGHPRGHGTPAVPRQETSASPPKDEEDNQHGAKSPRPTTVTSSLDLLSRLNVIPYNE